MENSEKAKYIDALLNALYIETTPMSFAEVIENRQLAGSENTGQFRTLEFVVEDLGVVKLIRGRDNSTLNGQCEYIITRKGRELIEKEMSSLWLMELQPFSDLLDRKNWDDYLEAKVDKRVEQADYFIDLIISERLLNLDKLTIKKHFKAWFLETQEFDFEIVNNDLAIEDGDLKFVPDLDQKHIAEFIKWFNGNKQDFLEFLKNEGVSFPEKVQSDMIINNSGSMIINKDSNVKKSIIHSREKGEESTWSKANIIIAAIACIATIIGILITLL